MDKLFKLLKFYNLTISTAESCTGGMIASAITNVSGASAFFGTGVVTYSNEAKMKLISVNKETLDKYGAVSEQTATEMAATIVNPPGKSEHQTGLAADICTSEMVNQYGSLPEQFAQTEAYTWLYEHCDEYGFILRYPEDKEDVTGITFEPWHYRYVGKEYAKEIMDKQICLEEYVEQLASEKAALLKEK